MAGALIVLVNVVAALGLGEALVQRAELEPAHADTAFFATLGLAATDIFWFGVAVCVVFGYTFNTVSTSIQALIQPVPDRETLTARTRTLRHGDELDLDELARWLWQGPELGEVGELASEMVTERSMAGFHTG